MVDPDVVRTKLGHLERYVQGLAEKQDCTIEEYRTDDDLQDIVERRFEKAIQAAIDVASHVVSAEGYREPEDYGDLFRILEAEGDLPPPVADRMVELAGFRNVLAHEYATIVDEHVYEHLQELEPLRDYAGEIHALLG